VQIGDLSMPFENLATIKAGLEIVKALARREQKDHRLNDQVCKALRTLYFTPKGLLGLLKELERGNGVASNELRERLINFNDREWQVSRALDALDFEQLQRDLRLSLATAKTLDQIRLGKMSLRRDIQEEVNYYGQRGRKPNLDKLRALVGAIEELNSKIEEAERLVNSRAIER
jgi:hypothetical protein